MRDSRTGPGLVARLLRSAETHSWLFVGLICLVVVGLTAWRVEQSYEERIGDAKSTTAELAHSLANQAHATLHDAEIIEAGVIERLETEGASDAGLARLHRMMGKFVTATPGLHDIVAVSEDGDSLVGALQPFAKVNVADRAYFAAHRADPSTRALLGPPMQNWGDGGWSFTVSRRFNKPDGSFGGVVVALIDCDLLGRSYPDFPFGSGGTIWMISEDATLIAHQPFIPGAIGKNFATAPFVGEYRERGPVGSIENLSALDGKARVSSYHKVDGYGLVLFVSFPRDDVLRPWRIEAAVEFATAALVCAAIAMLGWRFMSQLRLRDQADVEVRRSEKRYKLLADHSSDVIVQLAADGRRQYVSPACERVLGYKPHELVGRYPQETVHPDDWPRVEANLQEMMALGGGKPMTYRMRRQDGVYVWVETQGRRPSEGESLIVAVRDITQRKRVEGLLHEANNHLQRQIMLDGLTGIANRRAFDLMLDKELRRAARSQTTLGLLILDVDNFKTFNDRYGHQPGDACLRTIAQAIAAEVRRPGDFAARYGGEEFVVLLPETDEAGAAAMAERIRSVIERLAIAHSGTSGGVATVSIGVAVERPQPARVDGAALVRLADAALYQAKAAGRNRTHSAASRVYETVTVQGAVPATVH